MSRNEAKPPELWRWRRIDSPDLGDFEDAE